MEPNAKWNTIGNFRYQLDITGLQKNAQYNYNGQWLDVHGDISSLAEGYNCCIVADWKNLRILITTNYYAKKENYIILKPINLHQDINLYYNDTHNPYDEKNNVDYGCY